MKKEVIKFCSHCGCKMMETLIPAETERLVYERTDIVFRPYGTPFNDQTGKRQYVKNYKCPKWKYKWLFESPHDNYSIDKIVSI